MAEYTYRCDKCGEFTIDKDIREPELKNCPTCNAEVKRVFKSVKYSWKCDGFAGSGVS